MYSPDGNLLWAKYFGGDYFDECTDMHVSEMGDIRMTGKFSVDVDFDMGDGEKILSTPDYHTTAFYFAVYDLDGNLINASKIGGGFHEGLPRCMSSDAAGNTYLTGYFSGDVTFNTMEGEKKISAPDGGSHMYVAKINKRGLMFWVNVIEGATYFNKAQSIVANDEGEVFLAGTFSGNISSGSKSLSTQEKIMDLFIAKVDLNGQMEWMRMIDGTERCNVSSITIDPTMNVFVAGTFEGSITPENADKIESYGKQDAFIFRYTRNGDHMWSHHLKGANDVYISSVFVNGMRNAHIVGSFVDVVQFSDEHALDAHLMDKRMPSGDAFIMKMK